jgi:FAD/FMN-containing dehydrogenase
VAPGESWGRWPRHNQQIAVLRSRFDPLPEGIALLPYGNGRSYGDVCLNGGGTLLNTRSLDHLIAFDAATGVLECEAGVLLSQIIELFTARGWAPPVVPGTALITVGGAIANDVHGKNHHRVGTFCHHVLDFELLRSSGEVLTCSPEQNPELFRATIAGLGLTGLIRSARLQLRKIAGPWIEGDTQRFANMEEFLQLSAASDGDYEYTVAWIDSTASTRRRGRGVFMRANHSAIEVPARSAQSRVRVPFISPVCALPQLSVRILNALYYHRSATHPRRRKWLQQRFLFPLDRILDWNRAYGPNGFFQYQCVLPEQAATEACATMLGLLERYRQGSFVSVLKKFGTAPSLGMLSFARPGVTLALDFSNQGANTLKLLAALDSVTAQAGGAVYPAKDARMSAASFQRFFPAWEQFQRFVDPRFSSSFWRRVTGQLSCSAS